jgi:hypothetical protein
MNTKQIALIGCLTFATHSALCGAEAVGSGQHVVLQAPAEAASVSGKVVETMDVSGYTYVLVDTGAKKVWVAATSFPVKVGDSVATTQGMAMQNYHSKTLNRDFDLVYFTGSLTVNGIQPAASNLPPALPKDHPPITNASAVAKVDLSGIKRAEGGNTVGEIFAGKEKLTGQKVKIRGKVVKYNPMIMNKNWVHLRDGTGAEGSNDLLVTTSSEAKVGDTVLVTGTVSINKDFGAGYKYAVLVEDAKLVVE